MLPTGTRRRLPRGGKAATHSFVDLWPAHRGGDVFQGFVRVPDHLVGAKEHTKERGEFIRLINDNTKRWVEWKAKQGWVLNDTPHVAGPFDPPTEHQGAIDSAYPPHKRYVITARFTRETPQWIPLDAALYIRDQAEMYGIDLRDSSEVKDTGPDGGKAEIIDDGTPAHDPMKFAAERRARLGIKREDLLVEEFE